MNIEDIKKIAEEEMNKSIMGNLDSAIIFKYISNLENELKKKDLVINEMAECIGQDMRCVRPEIECNKMTHDCRECVKEYYFNKVEREGK